MSPEERHLCMSKVKGKNTKIEILVRKHLFALGYRYRLYVKELPGHPDIVLPKYKSVIFINGCFWHGHQECKKASIPETNRSYWKAKIESNIQRDTFNAQVLRDMGWNVITIWECQLKKKKFEETMKSVVQVFMDYRVNLSI